jgi:vitamin B12 transporter
MSRFTSAALSGAVLSSIALLVQSAHAEEAASGASTALPPVVVKQAAPKPAKPLAQRKKKPEPENPATGQAQAGQDESQVALSPSLQATPLSQLGSSVTVITSKDLEAKQTRTLTDALESVPGLNVTQAGGPGAITSVFMRGAGANHTKVLIDGIDASDPSSPDGAFDFGRLLTAGVDRVEVLRGPQSGLYGSDAIGGVIDIRTKPGSGPAQITATTEAGSFATFNQSAGVSGSSGPLSYSFNAAHFHAGDIPVTPPALLAPGEPRNNDSYDNHTYAGRLGLELSRNFDVGVIARFFDTRQFYTGTQYAPPTYDPMLEPTQSLGDTRQWFTRAFAHQTAFGGAFEQTLGVSYTDYWRQDNDAYYGLTLNSGDRVKFDWTGAIKLAPGQTLTVGAEHREDQLRNPQSAQVENNAGFVQLQSGFGGRLFNVASIRYDDNSAFGGATTYRIAPAFLIPETGTKLKASYGTGFKAPTLDELYVNYPNFGFHSNPDLKPEESRGYDAGFEQTLFAKRVEFGATYFHNDITNLITFGPTSTWPGYYTYYLNLPSARIDGAETFVTFKPRDDLKFRADYTYTMAMDAQKSEELRRRPKHKASVGADWQASQALNLSATLVYVGDFVDTDRFGSIPRLNAPGHTVVNLAGSYDFGNGLTAFARFDNLFNEIYEDPTGYLRPGFGAFAGMKVSLNASDLSTDRN